MTDFKLYRMFFPDVLEDGVKDNNLLAEDESIYNKNGNPEWMCSGFLYWGIIRRVENYRWSCYVWVDENTSEIKHFEISLHHMIIDRQRVDQRIYDMYNQSLDFEDIFAFLRLCGEI